MALRSGITRAFDFGDSGNRFILGWTPLVGVVAGVATLAVGDGWGESFRNGVGAGGAGFLAWAITRELHPDHRGVAVFAALLAPLGLLRSDPDLLAAAVVLLVSRVVAGTTGRALRWFDLGLVAVVSLPVAWRTTGAGVLTAAAVALACTIPVQSRHRAEFLAVTLLLFGAAIGAVIGSEFGYEIDPWFIAPAILGAIGLLGPARVVVGTDRSGGVISPIRVRGARLFALVAAVAAGIAGAPGAAMVPVWSALAVVGLRPR